MSETARPLLINLAPTGMVPMRKHSPHVPLSEDEIVRDVLECASLGIAIAHIHVRDEDGRPSFAKERYRRVIAGIRSKRDDLVLCVSCSGRGGATLEQRAEVLELTGDDRPDMASLTLSSLNFPTQASINAPDTVRALLARMNERSIRPELEVFDLGMANMARYLADRGELTGPLYANLLVGTLAGAQFRLLDTAALVAALPAQTTHSFAGLGASQLPMGALAVAAADGVRIGLEDNLWYDPERQQPATNAGLVERVLRLADAVGRPVLTPADVSRALAIAPR